MIKKIAKNIYISGKNEVFNTHELQFLGIDAILNVALEVDDPIIPNMLQVKVGLTDDSKNPDYMKSLAIVAFGTLVENGRKVLIHCVSGVNRSPYIVFRYLAEKEHRTIEALYKEFMGQYPDILIGAINYNV